MSALLSVWIALGAFLTTLVLVAFPGRGAEAVVTLLPYTLALSATLAAAALWACRKAPARDPAAAGQRLQAVVAVVLNGISFAILLFALQSPRHAILGLVIEIGFLWVCWFGYRRVVLKE